MAKVLIATVKPFSAEAVEEVKVIFQEAGYEVEVLSKYPAQSDLVAAVADADAMIIRSDKVDREVLEAAAKLKIVVRAGAGYDNVDLEAATEKGVVVMNTPGQNSNAVAELAVGMMVYMNRSRFTPSAGTELRGKKLGIHAYGYVGRIVGMIAKGFGMKVYAYDPFIDPVIIKNDGVTVEESAEGLYSKCEYISLHIPANAKTRGSVNFELMNSMPTGATLVNTARKEVIDEEGLKKIFQERDDFRYLSDIAPDCKEELMETFGDRVFFSPKKMGAQTAEANLNAGVAAARQIVNFIENGDTTFKVN
jgi:D-3-phosphoglycerate dehydrogenase